MNIRFFVFASVILYLPTQIPSYKSRRVGLDYNPLCLIVQTLQIHHPKPAALACNTPGK
jgi:hypothetical protein